MNTFRLTPTITEYPTCSSFIQNFEFDKDDLLFISNTTYSKYFKGHTRDATILLRGDYGSGEPTDEMVEQIYQVIKDLPYKRVIAIGGGSILDTAKLFCLKTFSPVLDLFDHKIKPIKDKEFIAIPTTCGTGSEVTNISILELKSRQTKLGLAHDALYPDATILIPELLEELPFSVFATSSIDALIHALESYLSPKATDFSRLYSIESTKLLLSGYMQIKKEGAEARIPLLHSFLIASTYAGIAFGNAGTGAVHAMSYPFGAKYHVPHGESNYVMFSEVFKKYQELSPDGDIAKLNEIIADIIDCSPSEVYSELDDLLSLLIEKKPLCEYGVSQSDLISFTENVMTKQGRLMANCYVPLRDDMIYSIYDNLFNTLCRNH